MDLPRTLRPVRRLKLLKDLILEKLDASLSHTRLSLENDTVIMEILRSLQGGVEELSHRAGGLASQAEALSNDTRLGLDNDALIMEMLRTGKVDGKVTTEQKTGLSHSRLFLPFEERERSYVILKQERTHRPGNPSDLPLPPTHLLLGHADAAQFLSWGELHFSAMARILKDSVSPLARGQTILDFGCGSGRLIRWLCDMAEDSEIWGVDIQAEHLLWCKQNLQPPFHFAVNTIVPHLPFEDNHFDLIYAGSVFTHIDDLVDSWLLELRRVLKPNGKLYITIHDNTSISKLKNELREQPLGKLYNSYPEFVDYTARDFAFFTIGRSDESQVFYDLSYFCDMVGSDLYQVLTIEQNAYGHQTAILLQKSQPAVNT